MDEERQLPRIVKLGVSGFETVKRVQRRQARMLRLLQHSSVDPNWYAGLDACRLDYCGRVNCLEACPFGALRRRLRQVPSALRLLQDANPPFHEVSVSRALWSRPFGKLVEVSVAAARQLNCRALDSLYIREGALYHRESVLAVGSFKVAASPPNETERWICEIHQVVASAQKEELERALSTRRYRGETRTKVFYPFEDYVRVQEIKDLASMVSKVLRSDLSGWQHAISPERPTKAQRKEFYRWLLGLRPDTRLICYGCDKNFKKLERRPKPPPPPKGPRTRPSPPEWSRFGSDERYRMGTDPNWNEDCIRSPEKGRPGMDVRLYKYFTDPDLESYYNDIDE
jgi:hypothetical protein